MTDPGAPVAVAPVHQGPRRSVRIPWGPVAVFVLAGLILWLGLTVWVLLKARTSVAAANAELRDLRRELTVESLIDGSAVDRLEVTLEAMRQADSDVSSWILAPARHLPWIGTQLTSADRLATVGVVGLEVALDTARASEEIIGNGDVVLGDLPDDLASLSLVLGDARQRLSGLDLGPREGLVAPLADIREQVDTSLTVALDQLDRAVIVTAGLSDFLEGPRTYLLVAANNAEMRSGQGAGLSFGLFSTRSGGVVVGDMQPVWRVPEPDGVEISDPDLAARWGWLKPNEQWGLVGLSPRFETTAQLVADMWSETGGIDVDGVLWTDPFALAAILEVTGPVETEEGTLTADNVVDVLLNGQYLDLPLDNAGNTLRKERLATIAPAILVAMLERDIDEVALVRALARVVNGRHIMAWSPRTSEERLWEEAGMAGHLEEDSLLVSVVNRGPNKLDYYLPMDSRLTIIREAESTSVEVEVTLTNETPPGLPAYVAGPVGDTPTPADHYAGILTVNVPGPAVGTHIVGVDDLTVVGGDGPTRVVGAEILLAPGESRTWNVRFELPADVREITIEPSARFPVETWTVETPGVPRVGEFDDGLSHLIEW